MSTIINPIPAYASYPITGIPVNNEPNSALVLQNIFQNIYDRVHYIKGVTDTLGGDISTVSGSVLTLSGLVSALGASVNTANSYITNMNNNVGGNIKNASKDAFSNNYYFLNVDTYKLCLEKLAVALKTLSDTLAATTPTVATNVTNIQSLVGKISEDALNGLQGFNFSGYPLLVSGENTEDSLKRISKILDTQKRVNDWNFFEGIRNWALTELVDPQYVYDSMIDESKIYYNALQPTSTVNSYDSLYQSFGHALTTWYLYSTLNTIAGTTNRIKLRMQSFGTVAAYASLGGISGTYTSLVENNWVTIPAGTSLVLKVIGSPAAKIYNYALLYKTI